VTSRLELPTGELNGPALKDKENKNRPVGEKGGSNGHVRGTIKLPNEVIGGFKKTYEEGGEKGPFVGIQKVSRGQRGRHCGDAIIPRLEGSRGEGILITTRQKGNTLKTGLRMSQATKSWGDWKKHANARAGRRSYMAVK